MFCTSLSSANDALPTPACTMPAFSTRNSTFPPLAPFTAAVTSMVTVPIFGFGIMPRGPRRCEAAAAGVRRGGCENHEQKVVLPPPPPPPHFPPPPPGGPGGFRFLG